MSKRFILLLLLLIAATACTANGSKGVTPASTTVGPLSVAPVATSTHVPVLATPTLQPSATPLPTATATAPAATETPQTETAGDLSLTSEQVYVHPLSPLYAGDSVTFQVFPYVPDVVALSDVVVRVEVEGGPSWQGGVGYNLVGRPMGLFEWVWDTGYEAGDYRVSVTLDPDNLLVVGDENPDNNQVVQTVSVLPAHLRPRREANAVWIEDEIGCCVLHVVSETAAYRDLPQLKTAVAAAMAQAVEKIGEQPEEKIHIYLIDRVLGQGGYAGSSMVVSYLDRNYAGGGLHEVLVHEIVHLLDQEFAPNRVPFLGEGLAVWATGGHYKQEDLDQRVRALHQIGKYVPLAELIDDFYLHQHEIGYLEAGGFISYLVRTYGWEQVRTFYGDVDAESADSQAQAVERSLQTHFGKSLAQVETEWKADLDALSPDEMAVTDLLATIRFYDIVRAYQLQYDPTAHFQQAWLPSGRELVERQLTADVTRHPDDEVNVTLEVMLEAVDNALLAGDHNRVNVILDSVERALDNGGLFLDPLGANYHHIVRKLMSLGYKVHRVDLEGDRAIVLITEGRRVITRPVNLVLRNQAWVLLN